MVEKSSEDEASALPEQPERVSRLRRVRTTYGLVSDILTPQRLGLLLAGALLLGVGALGGWDAAVTEADDVPRATPSVAAASTPFEITFRRARYGAALEPVFRAQDGVRYWFVSADVTNTSDAPVSATLLTSGTVVSLPGLGPGWAPESIADAALHRLSDGLQQHDFQPGLPTEVALVWQQRSDAEIPAEITVSVPRHTWRASSLDGSLGWRDPEPGLVVTVATDPLREA